MPRCAIDGNFDGADDASPGVLAVPLIVSGTPNWTTAPGAGDVIVDVGAVVSLDAVAGTNPGIRVSGLCAHVGEQVDRRLLHRDIGRGAAAIVRTVESPRPLNGSGTENERAGRVPGRA